MQLNKYFTTKFNQFPNVPVIVGADFDIEPNDVCMRNVIESVFVDFWTLQDQIARQNMNMNTLRKLVDDRWKNIPKQIVSLTVHNPYMPLNQGQKYPLSTKQKYDTGGLQQICTDYMLLTKVFTTQQVIRGEEKYDHKMKTNSLEVTKRDETKTQITLKQVIETKPEVVSVDHQATYLIPNEFFPSDHYSLAYNIYIQ